MKINRRCLGILLLLIEFISTAATDLKAQGMSCEEIKKASEFIPELNDSINISVSETSFPEFIRGIAYNENINISISPGIEYKITNNFSNVSIASMLCFLLEKYPLDVNIYGNIINITKRKDPEPIPENKSKIVFTPEQGTLSINSRRDSLGNLCKALTMNSPYNVIHDPKLENLYVNGFIKNLPVKEALSSYGRMNGLNVIQVDDSIYSFVRIESNQESQISHSNNREPNSRRGNRRSSESEFIADSSSITFNENGTFSVYSNNSSIESLLKYISDSLNINYYITEDLQGVVSTKLSNVTYPDFIETVFRSTEYGFRRNNNIYIIGPEDNCGINESKVIPLQFRSVNKLSDFLPVELTKDIDIKEFPELNSFLVHGNQSNIKSLENFIREIDQLVPVIMIEVIIVDISKKESMKYGITAGTSSDPVQTGGTLYPNLSYTFDAKTINSLLSSFNGFGQINLGSVAEDFYLNLKFLQENGIIKIRSTPKLSTINGTEASLSIGSTEYYLEEQSNLVVNQSTQNLTTKQYKPIQADLSVNILPIVSGNEQITLEIEVNHSDFTGRMSKDAPPGQTSRMFKSTIRVKNQEMVLLGGLQEKTKNNTHAGLPFLSKIPIIKWLFSNSSKEKQKTKLNIFIKPTIIY